jgi:hypothetical protein
MAFCNRLVDTVEHNPQFLDQLIVSDEAVFSLNSEVNASRNVIKYAPYGNGHPADHGPVVQKPINANLGLNLLNLGLNFNPRLLCVVQS